MCPIQKVLSNTLSYLESPFLVGKIFWKDEYFFLLLILLFFSSRVQDFSFRNIYLGVTKWEERKFLEINHLLVWSLLHNQKPKLFQRWSLKWNIINDTTLSSDPIFGDVSGVFFIWIWYFFVNNIFTAIKFVSLLDWLGVAHFVVLPWFCFVFFL